jgi:EAL domain-containing protein (putative c-di-GMP-specific phosphodiesterase class I)
MARDILAGIGALAGDPRWQVDIEITEGALFGDSSSCVHALRLLRLLRAAGVHVAIDDFGTGFSALGGLSELRIDTLKMDRMFTRRLPINRKSCTLVATIIGLAHAFEMTTVAEGVETQAQLDFLIRESCDESQGYLLAARCQEWNSNACSAFRAPTRRMMQAFVGVSDALRIETRLRQSAT